MKKTLLFLAAVAFSFTSAIAQGDGTVYTSNSSLEIEPGSVACGTTGGPTSENHYYKKFDLADLGVDGDVTFTQFQFGVESVVGAEVNLEVELWKTNVTTFPATWGGSDYESLTVIPVTVTADDESSLVTVDIPEGITINEDDIIIAEVRHDDLVSENFYIGSNSAADSQPSYLMAEGCGINVPTAVAAIGFADMNVIMTLISGTLSVEDFAAAELTLYPNPASDQFNISSGNELIQTVIVRDILGKTIETIQVNGLNQNVNISNLPKGLYLVEVELETGRAVQKLIKN